MCLGRDPWDAMATRASSSELSGPLWMSRFCPACEQMPRLSVNTASTPQHCDVAILRVCELSLEVQILTRADRGLGLRVGLAGLKYGRTVHAKANYKAYVHFVYSLEQDQPHGDAACIPWRLRPVLQCQ